jgi:hypothetical protein
MTPFIKVTLVCMYLIVNLLGFWNAQFYLECNEVNCNKLPAILLWASFIVMSIGTTFLMKPKSYFRILIRLIVTISLVLIGFIIFNGSSGNYFWGNSKGFIDHSLPGILMTFGFTAGLLIPEDLVIKDKKK